MPCMPQDGTVAACARCRYGKGFTPTNTLHRLHRIKSQAMPRKYFRKYLPNPELLLEKPYLKRLKPWLGHHNLWHLHRHSVAGGVAVGVFAGLLPAPFQMISAALLSTFLRVNLPVAVFTTLYTNPFTIVPIYILAYKVGAFFTGQAGEGLPPFEFSWQGDWLGALPAFIDWVLSLGAPLLLGLLVMGCVLAPASYFLVRGLWRLYVLLAWRKRRRQRLA